MDVQRKPQKVLVWALIMGLIGVILIPRINLPFWNKGSRAQQADPFYEALQVTSRPAITTGGALRQILDEEQVRLVQQDENIVSKLRTRMPTLDISEVSPKRARLELKPQEPEKVERIATDVKPNKKPSEKSQHPKKALSVTKSTPIHEPEILVVKKIGSKSIKASSDQSLRKVIKIVANSATLRAGPSITERALLELLQNTQLSVEEEKGPWLRVRTGNGLSAWISKSDVG